MPKKYVPKGKGSYAKHNYQDMEKAMQCVKEGFSIRVAAAKFGIAKSTLSDRVSGKTNLYGSSGRNPLLPNAVEKTIISQATASAEKGFGITRRQMLSRIGILCKNTNVPGFKNGTPSKHVWYGMKKRNPELTLRKPEKLGTVRARMLNPVVVEKYFTDLKNIITSLNLENKPRAVWNCDETGKSLEHTPNHVVAKKGTKHVVGRTSNDRSNITIMACGNAAGDKMPPMLITKGKTSKCLFGYNTADAPNGSIWAFQEKAWMNEVLCEQWFQEVFLKNCGPERPQLLLLDGHWSHETLGLLQLAINENISILAFPPHTTHFLQPLDRSVFGPFNKSYNKACSEFLSAAPCNLVNKWTFPGLFRHAWEEGVTKDNIVSGFKTCGIHPFNASAVPKAAFMPSSVYEKPQPLESGETEIIQELPGNDDNGLDKENDGTAHDYVTARDETSTSNVRVHDVSTASDFVNTTVSDDEIATAVASITDNHTFNVPVEVHSEFDPTLPSTSDLSVASDVHVEDPESLLELINTGVIGVFATADNDGVAELPSSLWNSEIEKLFSPQPNSGESKVTQKSRAITTHRLLTSASIIEIKTIAKNKKEEKARNAAEKKEKRERIKNEKAEKAQTKKSKN